MSQTPVTVTYSLEEVLGKINDKLDRLEGKVDHLNNDVNKLEKRMEVGFAELKGEINRVESKLTGEISRVEEQVKGIDKRLSNQEFFNRGVLVALIVALIGSAAKLFGLIGNP